MARGWWLMAAATLALVVAPPATAGSADAPEIVDPAGDTADPLHNGDIVAAWVQDVDATGFTTVIELVELDLVQDRLADHYFVFSLGGVPYCTFVYIDQAGEPMIMACRFDEARGLQASAEATTGNVTAGSPARVEARFPLGYLGDAAPSVITDLRVYTYDFKRVHPQSVAEGVSQHRVDVATSNATVALFSSVTATAPDQENASNGADLPPTNTTTGDDRQAAAIDPASEAPRASAPAAPALATLVLALVAAAGRRR